MPSIFSKIIQGEIPCEKILENQNFFSFLDIRPINPGHTLVIPKLEVDELFSLTDDSLAKILVFAKPIANTLKEVFPCLRVGMIVAGLEVPHAHIHLVPIYKETDLSFSNAKPASPDQLKEYGQKIRQKISNPL